MTSVRGTLLLFGRDEGFVGYTGGDADVKNQFDEIRTKAIYQNVPNVMAERGYSRTREQCRPHSY